MSHLHHPLRCLAATLAHRAPSSSLRSFRVTTTTSKSIPRTLLSTRVALQRRTYATSPPQSKKDSRFPVLPIIAILVGGSGLFYFLVQQRQGTGPKGMERRGSCGDVWLCMCVVPCASWNRGDAPGGCCRDVRVVAERLWS
ncbi:hypothetical protein BDZ91DRAFT_488258 [Kalaharituber pfeilii]|nr:hypothetical protein BDZ91DRAFT_488258 [Kalaharituber pfeilii]